MLPFTFCLKLKPRPHRVHTYGITSLCILICLTTAAFMFAEINQNSQSNKRKKYVIKLNSAPDKATVKDPSRNVSYLEHSCVSEFEALGSLKFCLLQLLFHSLKV